MKRGRSQQPTGSGRRPAGRSTVGLLILLLAGLALAGCPPKNNDGPISVLVSSDKDASTTPDPEQIGQAARVEGQLNWYTSLPEKDATAFLDAFKAKYPFIDARLHRSSTFDTISRLNEEIDSGEVRADVVHVLDVGVFIELRRRGELLRYASPEGSAIDDRFREPGYWWAMRLVAIGLAYNPKTLPPERAPRTWEDLLKPEFRGKIGFKDAATAGTAYAEYFLLRERYGTLFWERVAAQKPRISRSAEEVTAGLLDGSILVAGEMAAYAMIGAQEEGKSIAGVFPKEGVPFTPGPVAILARAPHPNAARLFIDYALSREGQTLFRDLGKAYSARKDVAPLRDQPPLSKLNLLTPTGGWEEYLQKQGALRTEFEKLFRPTSE
ncbi:MAG: extracellular solute-binding protein [Armatimonadetes bacterium]|nr:extracellular solute-binding protein [Armatimonadota bacterium]